MTVTSSLRPASMTEDVACRLVTAIAVGTFSPGERLPSERELATRLEVSRVTVRQALQRVGELGLVIARRGRHGGTFVTTQAWEDVAPEEARRTLETVRETHVPYDTAVDALALWHYRGGPWEAAGEFRFDDPES